ncbi:chemotaxis protein CheB [Thioclava sp. GXIMD4216]|uniref:chemotaxis protein CheB n=1 Tax=Thioclava sp. GXIMD4216 TaxID=3131929 RepID=UPI0030CF64C0
MTSDAKTPAYIVGIAASAGGLEATSLLAQNLPKSLDVAYVLAQHMSPSHKSMLVQLLARETSLAVVEIEERVVPAANTIHIPPPGHDVVLEDGEFVLRNPEGHPAAPKPSADRLFKSIASEVGERSVGIVLSGTGSDGSYGVQAIREAGGITIAQEPSSSKYDSMPVSAIRTGCVDLTLTPQQMGQHLAMILAQPRDLESLKDINEHTGKNSDLFQILLGHTLVDFRQYKESTINRRIHRRMIAKGIENYADYVELCRRSVDEVEALYRDLLISVTNFFRDPDQFLALRDAITKKVSDGAQEPLRVWIAGCATGEEAYSIAILIVEALGGLAKVEKDKLQIFATDIDDRALAIGRRGQYPASAVTDIPQEYLSRYFDLAEDHVVVKSKLRSFVMFSRHNVFQDAPFMSIDLVSIRNVLIYFEPKLQERVLTRIQYALKQDGLLFLGTSETTGALESFFVPLSQHGKILRKRSTRLNSAAPALNGSLPPANHLRAASPASYRNAPTPPNDWWRFDALAKSVVRNGFLTNRDRAVLKIYGDIAPFVEMRTPIHGGMTLDVLQKALAYEANSMVLVALKQREARSGQWHQVDGRDFNTVRMTAWPIIDDKAEEPVVLIGFETEMRSEPDPENIERSDYLNYLETELSRTRDTLQITIEQLQTSNEELQSLNEELQSSNEELQSTNEELETSNEELQSTNEELITVNEELLVNTGQLERTSAELNGLIKGLPTVMMMLDQGLLIRHASQSATRTFEIRERGHSLGHLSQCYIPNGYPPLVDICSQALLDRRPHYRQFEIDDYCHSLTVSPLVTENDGLIGLIVLITSVDMTVDSLLNQTLRKFSNIGTWRVNLATEEVSWSEETYAIHGMMPDKAKRKMDEAVNYYHPDDRDIVKSAIESALNRNEPFHFFARLKRRDGATVVVESSGSAVRNEVGEPIALIGVCRDFSRIQNENLLVRHYDEITTEQHMGFFSIDIINNLHYWNPVLIEMMDVASEGDQSLDRLISHLPSDRQTLLRKTLQDAIQQRRPFCVDETLILRHGASRKCQIRGNVECNASNQVTHLYGSIRVID